MAVALDSTGTNNTNGNSLTTIDLTTLTVGTGTNRLLLAFLHLKPAASAPSITWDPAGTNQAMTQEKTQSSSGNQTFVFKLVAPTAGNKTLRASWTGASDVVLGAAEFSGVDQTTPLVVADDAGTSGAAASTDPAKITINSATGDATVAGFTVNVGPTSTDQTTLYTNNAPATEGGAASYALGGTSNVHDTLGGTTASAWSAVGVHVQATVVDGGLSTHPIRVRLGQF